MPTARYMGNNGAVTIAGTTYAISEWSAEETMKTVEAPAAGDIATHRTPLHTDWKATAKAYLPQGAIRNPFTNLRAGTPVAFAGAVVSPSTGVWSATGLTTKVALSSPVGEHAMFDIEIECNDGSSQPTFSP